MASAVEKVPKITQSGDDGDLYRFICHTVFQKGIQEEIDSWMRRKREGGIIIKNRNQTITI